MPSGTNRKIFGVDVLGLEVISTNSIKLKLKSIWILMVLRILRCSLNLLIRIKHYTKLLTPFACKYYLSIRLLDVFNIFLCFLWL